MARLVIEEGGKRRAFKVGDGILTIGTGAEARLKVSSPDVAEIHAEVQITGGKAVLRPRPGVMPPSIAGQPINGETSLAFGQEATVGSVRLWIEDENAPSTAPAPVAKPAAAGSPQRDQAVRREQAIAKAKKDGDRSVVQRTKPRVERGLPAGVIVMLILGGVVVAVFAGWKAFSSGGDDQGQLAIAGTFGAVQKHITEGSFDLASSKLRSLEDSDLSTEQQVKLKELQGIVEERLAQMLVDEHHRIGTNYKNSKLEKYESIYLQGKPDKPRRASFYSVAATSRRLGRITRSSNGSNARRSASRASSPCRELRATRTSPGRSNA